MSILTEQVAQNSGRLVASFPHRLSIGWNDLSTTGIGSAMEGVSRVAIVVRNPTDLIRSLIAFDGQVKAMLLLSYALPIPTAIELARQADCEVLVSDCIEEDTSDMKVVGLAEALGKGRYAKEFATSWLMTTSGTTGIPKVIPHTLKSLARSVYRFAGPATPAWGLLYDPTRFAGLQVVLQAMIGGGSLIAVDTLQPLAAQINTLAQEGCTHLSATPTLWRRILMVPGHKDLALKQITLGGEIVDQPTLNALRKAFPQARLSHIYASTEVGVGFSVNDGLAGFPASYLRGMLGNIALKIVDDILWLRPTITTFTSCQSGIAVDADGYVRSGDQVSVDGERIVFLGRESGLINIGGVKVYPETVEAVVKSVGGVAQVQISGKRNPIMGQIIVANIQPSHGVDLDTLRELVLEACRASLPREAVPAIIRFVDDFAMNSAGKLVRIKE